MVKVFLELNSRVIRVPKAGLANVKAKPQPKESSPKHVGAPMPGTIVTVAVDAGQKVTKGDSLVSIEAMKIEMMLKTEGDGTVKAIHSWYGEEVNAKDLLLEFEQSPPAGRRLFRRAA